MGDHIDWKHHLWFVPPIRILKVVPGGYKCQYATESDTFFMTHSRARQYRRLKGY